MSAQDWITMISEAGKLELARLRSQWSETGGSYPLKEWGNILIAFADRELELRGVDPMAPAF